MASSLKALGSSSFLPSDVSDIEPRHDAERAAEEGSTYEVLTLGEASAHVAESAAEDAISPRQSMLAHRSLHQPQLREESPASTLRTSDGADRGLPQHPGSPSSYFAAPVMPLDVSVEQPKAPFAGPIVFDNLSAEGFEPFADRQLRAERLAAAQRATFSPKKAPPQSWTRPSGSYLVSLALQVATMGLGVRGVGLAVSTLRFGLAGLLPQAWTLAAFGLAAGYGLIFVTGALALYGQARGLFAGQNHLRDQWRQARDSKGFDTAAAVHKAWHQQGPVWPLAQSLHPGSAAAGWIGVNLALAAYALGVSVPVLGIMLAQSNLMMLDAWLLSKPAR